MKKYLYITIASLIAFVACDKEARVQEEVPGNEPVAEKLVSITASIPSDGLNTKVSITEADNGEGKMRLTKLSWEEGDEIIVNTKSFTVKPGSISGDGLTATFQGKDPGSGPYDITYTNVPGDPNNQEQPADGDPSDVGYSVSLTGADSYEGATFSSIWAGSHGATFAQSSVLQLRALLPAAVAAGVKKVIFKSTANIFTGSNTLTVTLTSAGTTGTDNKLDVYAMLPAGNITLAADMDLLVQFEMDGGNAYDKYTAFRHFASGTNFVQSGCTKYMGLDCSNIDKYANASAAGVGGSSNHILIGDQNQMSWLASNIASGNYIDLVDDIDMTGVASSLNPSGAVTFNGNSKTISNTTAPLFDDLKGTVSNFTISNAVITSAETVGILAKTCNNVASDVDGVTISGSSLTGTASSGTYYFGGLVGEVSSASTFDDCHLDESTLTSTKYMKSGGLFGYIHNSGAKVGYTTGCSVYDTNTLTLKDNAGGLVAELDGGSVDKSSVACAVSGANTVGGLISKLTSGTLTGDFVTGDVTSSYQTVGGLIGKMSNGTVNGCYATGNVTHNYSATYAQAGGLIGDMSGGSLELCHATGTVKATNKGANVGGLIGTNSGGTIDQCYATGAVTGPGNSVGGFIGNMGNGAVTITKSYATGLVTSGGSGCGGFIGTMTGNNNKTISECYATGNYNPGDKERPCGGFFGQITGNGSGSFSIHDCFATGKLVTSNGYQAGGFVGLVSKTAGSVSFSQCFASGDINQSWGYPRGGFAGRIETSIVTIQKCAAWNNNVKGQSLIGRWSTGAIVGVAHPACTLTDNYRNPNMHIWAFWGTESGNYKYQLTTSDQHENVSSSQLLMRWDAETDGALKTSWVDTIDNESATNSQFAYQGKCVAGKTLSWLAGSAGPLNWGSTYWDYSQDLPRLKWTL